LFPFQTGASVFLQLRGQGHNSILRGRASPEAIVAAAVEQQMPAVALTDSNGMYATVSFYQTAKKAGIKPIVGVALDVAADGGREILRSRTSKNHRASARNGSFKAVPLVLVAADRKVYSN
jgi:DNA polymerase III alpha subunit